MTFNFKLSRLFSKIETRKAAFYFFLTTKVSIACENIRFFSLSASLSGCFRRLKLAHLFRHYDILAKTRSRLTMVITFSRQNDVGSRASTS